MPRLRSCEDTALHPAAKLPGGPQAWATRPGSSHTREGVVEVQLLLVESRPQWERSQGGGCSSLPS